MAYGQQAIILGTIQLQRQVSGLLDRQGALLKCSSFHRIPRQVRSRS